MSIRITIFPIFFFLRICQFQKAAWNFFLFCVFSDVIIIQCISVAVTCQEQSNGRRLAGDTLHNGCTVTSGTGQRWQLPSDDLVTLRRCGATSIRSNSRPRYPDPSLSVGRIQETPAWSLGSDEKSLKADAQKLMSEGRLHMYKLHCVLCGLHSVLSCRRC